MKHRAWPVLLAAVLFGCGAPAPGAAADTVRVVLEDTPGVTAQQQVLQVERGSDAVFTLTAAPGLRVLGADYADSTVAAQENMQENMQGDHQENRSTTAPAADHPATAETATYTLTLPQVNYTTAVALQTRQDSRCLTYNANGGPWADVAAWVRDPGPMDERPNTLPYSAALARPSYTLTGWNTAPDGSGTAVGLGSRLALPDGETALTLYAQWQPWADAGDFTWQPSGDGAVITGYSGSAETLCIPGELEGRPVYALADGALAGAACETVILPATLRRVESGAFTGCALRELVLFDTLADITDSAFTGCTALRTLRINAATAPVYSGSYYATFADKYDRLLALAGQKKLILFSGSSTRFGYDSAALDAALPDYAPVNLGVFAYTNALPQLLLILQAAEPGDILLHAPEFDAAQRQFCTTTALDAPFFAMCEANYDLVAALDLRGVSSVFTAYAAYQHGRSGMAAAGYDASPCDYDEDGNPVSTPSYNAYGDYVVPRPNAADDTPIYGLPVDYTVAALPQGQFIDAINSVYSLFLQKGVAVYFTYAPRNVQAVSEASTPAARAALDDYLRENLAVPVISDLEESLYPGRYLSGTDNHLSDEGVQLRTQRILADLRRQLAAEAETEADVEVKAAETEGQP